MSTPVLLEPTAAAQALSSQGQGGAAQPSRFSAGGQAVRADDVLAQLDAVAGENAELGRELLRCYEQLSLVFEITEHIGTMRDPQQVEEALLRRFATMLSASAVLCDHGGRIFAVDIGRDVELSDGDLLDIQRSLAEDIAYVRQNNRARVGQLPGRVGGDAAVHDANGTLRAAQPAPAGVPRYYALVGALRQCNADSAVVIALRRGSEQHFDSADMLVSESVLGYGGHIVSNLMMVRSLQQMAYETIRALVRAIDAKDKYTSGHSERVGWLSALTARALGLPDGQVQMIEWAGLLHDVGKIGVPEEILNKPGRLTVEEFEIMKRHPRLSYEVLKPVASLARVLDGVLYHHENHDGSGYPEKLAGEQIPLSARIIHVVDIFDALTSSRSYREGFSVEKAFGILEGDAGRVTDPAVTQVFIDCFKRYMAESPADFGSRFSHIPGSQAASGASTKLTQAAGTGG